MRQFLSERFWHNGNPVAVSDVRVENCSFQAFVTRPNQDWNRFINIHLHNPSQENCSIDCGWLEDVTVHNLKRLGSSPLFLWGCVYRRVKLSGRISGLKINRSLGPENQALQSAHDRRVEAFYRDSDWALDISEAQFPGSVTFEAIPGDLIIRNPQTQKLVRRSDLSKCDWRSLEFEQTGIDIALSWFEKGSLFDSVVIIARSDKRYAESDQRVLDRLVACGVAEAD